MQNSTLKGNNCSADENSGYSAKDLRRNSRRSAWRPTNLNLERFTLDECSNMTQTHKYSVSTNTSSGGATNNPQGQATTSNTKVNNTTTANNNAPKKSCINCGWVMTTLVGLSCLAFILCIYLIPSEGIFPVSVNLRGETHHSIRNRGNLVVYPTQVSRDAISRNINDSYVISVNPSHHQHLANTLHNITSEYNRSSCNEDPAEPYVNCYLENPSPNSPCAFERGWLGSRCTPETNFGYKEVDGCINPCFLVRLMNTEDWYPENWLPKEVGDTYKMKYGSSFIGLNCHPQKYEDRDKVQFTENPMKGFPQDFFPVSDFKTDRYIYPAVMVQMHGLLIGHDMTIVCKLRARNAYELLDSGSITISFQAGSKKTTNDGPIALRRNEKVQSTQDLHSSLTPAQLSTSTKTTIVPTV